VVFEVFEVFKFFWFSMVLALVERNLMGIQ
jgi:hypothetical protein